MLCSISSCSSLSSWCHSCPASSHIISLHPFCTAISAASTSMSRPDVDATTICQLLDVELSRLGEPWTGRIPFRLAQHPSRDSSDVPDLTPSAFSEIDLCRFLDGKQPVVSRLYFNPAAYPPPPENASCNLVDYVPWKSLKRDLMRAAHASGSPVCTSGRNSRTDKTCRFRCSCFRNQRAPVDSSSCFRQTSLIANHKNKRPQGRSLPRRTNGRSTQGTCMFRFVVKWDQYGFYVNLWRCSGNPEHSYHPRPTESQCGTFPTHLLTEEERERAHGMWLNHPVLLLAAAMSSPASKSSWKGSRSLI